MDSDIKAVVLDVDGTLCSLTKGVGEIYAELLTARGYQVEVSRLKDSVAAEWRELQPLYLNVSQDHRTNPEREREVWCEYVRRVLQRAGVSYRPDDGLVAYVYDSFATKRYRTVAPGAAEFLDLAHQRGLKVFAATNNDERTKSVLRELGVLASLSGVFTAGELGWKKPSPRFYQNLERQLGFEPSRLVHVGNSIGLDIEPAQRAGWKAVLFGSTADDGVFSVRSFEELRQTLGV